MSNQHLQKQFIGFLNTPPLWHNEQFGIQQFEFPEINLADFIPEAIPQKLRLGHQMEHVFKQLIAHSSRFEILLHNLPIKEGNRTIGEIDFILRDVKTNKRIHVELTYKFYIINTEIRESIHRLIGPNRRDTFFAKMEKIKNVQFQLLHSKEGSKALNERNIDHTIIQHQVCYKGQLFLPWKDKSSTIHPLNTSCISGYWLRFSDFKSEEFKEFQFYIPFKSEWVIEPNFDVNWRSHFEALAEINLQILIIRSICIECLFLKKIIHLN